MVQMLMLSMVGHLRISVWDMVAISNGKLTKGAARQIHRYKRLTENCMRHDKGCRGS